MSSNGILNARRASTAVLWLALLGGCATQADLEGGEVAASEQAIQEAYVAFSEVSTVRWVQLLTSESMSTVGRSVGVIRGISNRGFRYNCGVTFISPRFAVTAAHCVDKLDIAPLGLVNVQHVNTRNLQSAALVNSTVVSGTWPNYTHPSLGAAGGYVTTSFTCSVEVGCDTAFNRTASCPLPTNTQVDMALLRCNERVTHPTYGSSFVPVTGSDTGTKQVQTWWFHEVYQLATQSSGAQPGPSGNFSHYGLLTNPNTENYHYRVNHSYLPLRSSTWPGGTPYKQIGNTTQTTKTDVPVCHGTSGSGVFERGTTLLFGPMVTGGADSAVGSRLCENMDGKAAGQHLSTHIRRTQTVKLENLDVVQKDRAGDL